MQLKQALTLSLGGLLMPVMAASNDTSSNNNTEIVSKDQYNTPAIHFTPPKGWMNDPNGLFYNEAEELYHLYYQYYPNDTIWGLPLYWGHATSENLLTWDHHAPALGPNKDDEGIFSGSIVVDKENTSGFFDDDVEPENRVVAIFTNHITGLETQDLAFSSDGGYTFTKYDQNPVIDVNSSQFRDPKVLWHEETNKWVMTLAKAQEYKIQIYTSDNLKDWDFASNFSLKGYVGYQYECPGLFKLPIENAKKGGAEEKYVMALAINPGSPLGGSINEYFVGEFNGTHFVADDDATRFMDLGKDFYAFQGFYNSPEDKGFLGLAWASNWQYGNRVPDDDGYRSSMSLAREYTLRYVSTNPESEQLLLVQKPVLEDDFVDVIDEYKVKDLDLNKSSVVKTNFIGDEASTGVLDFKLNFTLTNNSLTYRDDTTFEIRILSDIGDEVIRVGYDAVINQYYLNRHTSHVFQRTNQFFQERWSTYIEHDQLNDDGWKEYSVYGVVDKNILELFFNDGAFTSTNTFFFEQGVPANIEIVTEARVSFITIDSLTVRHLGVDSDN